MTIAEFEKAVWTEKRIRIVLPGPVGAQVGGYGYQSAAPEIWTLRASCMADLVCGRKRDFRLPISSNGSVSLGTRKSAA